ncbi:hypothetical protein RV11_GL001043 [Enterococcus phoeniculicola]|jgi:AcrR family transcriptional regulator|nr:hypothetical protein RV11_GL001043 [Enterococcus phoeniculicola]
MLIHEKESVYKKGAGSMRFSEELMAACQKGQIGEPQFIRLSYYTNKEELFDDMLEQVIHLLLVVKKAELQILSMKINQMARLLIGKFRDDSLLNCSIAQIDQAASPLLKVEIVGTQGMIQYDTSADNAFSGDYQLCLLQETLTVEEKKRIQALMKRFQLSENRVEE